MSLLLMISTSKGSFLWRFAFRPVSTKHFLCLTISWDNLSWNLSYEMLRCPLCERSHVKSNHLSNSSRTNRKTNNQEDQFPKQNLSLRTFQYQFVNSIVLKRISLEIFENLTTKLKSIVRRFWSTNSEFEFRYEPITWHQVKSNLETFFSIYKKSLIVLANIPWFDHFRATLCGIFIQ